MKRIINGRKYDTQTAKYLGSQYDGEACAWWVRIDVYQKKTGEFFARGTASEEHPEFIGDIFEYGWIWEKGIKPLTVEEMKEWAEEHLTCDEYESLFGTVEE